MKNHNLATVALYPISLVVVGLLLAIASSGAMSDEDQIIARKLRASGQILALEKIHELAKKIKHGEILETELEKKRDRYVYEVELLDKNGQVWEIKFDAKTGRLIKLENED